jgi:hypothetical protein
MECLGHCTGQGAMGHLVFLFVAKGRGTVDGLFNSEYEDVSTAEAVSYIRTVPGTNLAEMVLKA